MSGRYSPQPLRPSSPNYRLFTTARRSEMDDEQRRVQAGKNELEEEENVYLFAMNEILDRVPNKLPTPYMNQLSRHVYVGSQNNADDESALRHEGITHVLNVAGTRNFDLTKSPYSKEASVYKYLMIPSLDDENYDIRKDFPKAFRFMDDARRSGGKVLVHCIYGINRSGAVCAAYLVSDERVTLLQAIERMKSKRNVILTNHHFRRQLVKYARTQSLLDSILPQWVQQMKAAAEKQAKRDEKKVENEAEIVVGLRNSMKRISDTYSNRTDSRSSYNSLPRMAMNGAASWRSGKDVDRNGCASPLPGVSRTETNSPVPDRSYCASPVFSEWSFCSSPGPGRSRCVSPVFDSSVSERGYTASPLETNPGYHAPAQTRIFEGRKKPSQSSSQTSSYWTRRQFYTDGGCGPQTTRSNKSSNYVNQLSSNRSLSYSSFPSFTASRDVSTRQKPQTYANGYSHTKKKEEDYVSPYSWLPDEFWDEGNIPLSKLSSSRRKTRSLFLGTGCSTGSSTIR